MSRQAKILIFGLVLIFSIYQKQTSKLNDNFEKNTPIVEEKSPDPETLELDDLKKIADTEIPSYETLDYSNSDFDKDGSSRPENGFSPYDSFFGRGIYDNSTTNYIEIDNQTNSDAVVLLVNAYSERKVRNEYVRKKTKFKMTSLPDGVYYIRMMSGNSWSNSLKVGPLTGGFLSDRSISGNSDSNDWMKIGTTYADYDGSYYEGYSQTLHGVVGGNVESESLTADEFAK